MLIQHSRFETCEDGLRIQSKRSNALPKLRLPTTSVQIDYVPNMNQLIIQMGSLNTLNVLLFNLAVDTKTFKLLEYK